MSDSRALIVIVVLALVVCLSGCVQHRQMKSNALEFLYPEGSEAIPAKDVELQLPVRVGIAFAPSPANAREIFTETQKQSLLKRIAAAFGDREGIASVEAVPSNYLSPGGGFQNVDRIATAFGIDLIAIVSYDQFQFSESGRSSWAYWTLVGAYVVKGEKNETRTILNTVVYDIPSRVMLFNASGQSTVTGKSLPVQIDKALRMRSEQGFEEATDDLIATLDTALDQFQEQAATGTVRGPGTAAIAMVDASGQPVGAAKGGGGALPAVEAIAAALLVSLAMVMRRDRGH